MHILNNRYLTLILWVSGAVCLSGCAHDSVTHSEPNQDEITFADKAEYGYSPANPIKVGDSSLINGVQNQRIYLSSLRGVAGESVNYKRLGSCCAFETPNGYNGGGLLDRYEVFHEGLAKPVVLYLNMYDPGELIAPKGFVIY